MKIAPDREEHLFRWLLRAALVSVDYIVPQWSNPPGDTKRCRIGVQIWGNGSKTRATCTCLVRQTRQTNSAIWLILFLISPSARWLRSPPPPLQMNGGSNCRTIEMRGMVQIRWISRRIKKRADRVKRWIKKVRNANVGGEEGSEKEWGCLTWLWRCNDGERGRGRGGGVAEMGEGVLVGRLC